MTNDNEEPTPPRQENNRGGFSYFVQHHKGDAIAYLILFLGLITCFINQILGGFVVGVIIGLYFSDSLRNRFEILRELIAEEGFFHGFVAIAAVLALFITTLGLSVGTVLGVYIRPMFGKSISSPFDNEK